MVPVISKSGNAQQQHGFTSRTLPVQYQHRFSRTDQGKQATEQHRTATGLTTHQTSINKAQAVPVTTEQSREQGNKNSNTTEQTRTGTGTVPVKHKPSRSKANRTEEQVTKQNATQNQNRTKQQVRGHGNTANASACRENQQPAQAVI